MSILKIINKTKTSNSLEATICIENVDRQKSTSVEYSFLERVTVAFKVFIVVINYTDESVTKDTLFFIKVKKIQKGDLTNYKLCLTSLRFKINEKVFQNDEGTWQLITEEYTSENSSNKCYDISIYVDSFASFKQKMLFSLHEDSELTDFVLKGKDGSVLFHRSILAAISPMLKKMLTGSWKEAKEGSVDLADLSKSTLQHLKDFIYTEKLPEDDESLQKLLMLSKYYMIEYLEQMCISELISNTNAAKIFKLLDFSFQHQITELTLKILNEIQQGAPKVQDIRKHLEEKLPKCEVE